ncbi:MAG: nitroreductase family protein [Candidatus Niyogibacteria bacterium]|nr:nitroreductase family protein [Candidatus Niyogibacteria bacterium]
MKIFLDVIKKRKSVRSFLAKTVDLALIKEIIALATYAPTSCNQQLWNFIVIDDALTKEKLIKEAAANTLIRRAPVVIAVTYDGWNYKEALQGASLAVGHILLAAEYYGLGALPINSYGADCKVKKILNIPVKEKICCFIALGHPDERAQQSPLVSRRPVEEVFHQGKFRDNNAPPFTYDPNDWSLENLRNHQKYYCRKTFLGKEMDIMNQRERELIKNTLGDIKNNLLDLFSYDGSFLKEFPLLPIIAMDLTQETSAYTRAAVRLFAKNKLLKAAHIIYDDKKKAFTENQQAAISLIYKLERISDALKENLFIQAYNTLRKEGEFIIIARKSNIFLSFFFFAVRLIFGQDVRKTGIYSFFGPYQPVSLRKTKQQLKKAGFRDISWSGYFFIPVFYEQIYQMIKQYIRSGGTSYLHREPKEDAISKFLSFIMKIQGLRKFGLLGSVAVIICRKQ